MFSVIIPKLIFDCLIHVDKLHGFQTWLRKNKSEIRNTDVVCTYNTVKQSREYKDNQKPANTHRDKTERQFPRYQPFKPKTLLLKNFKRNKNFESFWEF